MVCGYCNEESVCRIITGRHRHISVTELNKTACIDSYVAANYQEFEST
jgi:hypothetical protein